MTVEETCTCGATFIVRTYEGSSSWSNRDKEISRAWAEVDRWRRQHKECRQARPAEKPDNDSRDMRQERGTDA